MRNEEIVRQILCIWYRNQYFRFDASAAIKIVESELLLVGIFVGPSRLVLARIGVLRPVDGRCLALF